jgi:GNAT superfamily N-acetyltransferase
VTYHLHHLDRQTGPAYQHVALHRDRGVLADLAPDGRHVAVGAHSLGVPVGLVLATTSQDQARARVVSLIVAEAYRNRGIASALLKALTQELQERGCIQASMQYQAQLQTGPALERVLEQCGWRTQADSPLFVARRPDEENRWYHRTRRLPAGVELFDWVTLRIEETRALLELCRTDVRYRGAVIDLTEDLEPLNSLGLRCGGEIVGWLHVRRSAPDIVLYAALWVRDDRRRGGTALTLLGEGIKRACHAGIAWHCWYVASENQPMLAIAQRFLAADLVGTYEVRSASIALVPVLGCVRHGS